MSQYPVIAFPTNTRKYNRENQRLFTDYGCLESVHIDSCQMNSILFTRKQRPILWSSSLPPPLEVETMNQRILVPMHDFLTLGVPQSLKNIQTEDIIPSNFIKEKKIRNCERTDSKAKTVHAISVTESINSFVHDHPETAYGNLSKLMGKCASLENMLTVRKMCNDFDPSLCGIGRRILWQLSEDDARTNIVEHYSNRWCTGGCLSYQRLDVQMNKEIGVLVCPQGRCLDELVVKPISIDFKGFTHVNGDDYASPNVKTGPEIRQKLNGCVQQVEVGSSLSSDRLLFATRSDYHVLLSAFNQLSLDNSDGELNFSGAENISSLGLLKSGGSQRTCSIALNPYLAEECAVTSEDGVIRLWNVNVSCNTSGVALKSLQVLSAKKSLGLKSGDGWSQVCFAAHPRQLFIADHQNICLFDIRGRNISTVLDMKKSSHVNKQEKLYCMKSGRGIDNEYQCVVGTDHNIFVLDQRHCGEPVIQFGTSMSHPPLYLKTVKVCDRKMASNSRRLVGANSSYALVIGNQRPSDMFCYQLSKAMTICPPHVSYPLQSIGAPRSLGDSNKEQSSAFMENLKEGSSRMMAGLEATSIQLKHEERDCHGIIVFQMTSLGDIGYQTLFMETFSRGNAMSDVVSKAATSAFFKHKSDDSLLEPSEKRVTYSRQINAAKVLEPPDKCSKPFSKLNLDCDLPLLEIESNALPSTNCRLCKAQYRQDRCGLLNEMTDGRSFPAKLELVDIDARNEVYDNEIGSVLKATWNTSYEEYWESQKTAEEGRMLQERVQQNRLTLDLNRSDDNVPVELEGILQASSSTDFVGPLENIKYSRKKQTFGSSAVCPRAPLDQLKSNKKQRNSSASLPETSLASYFSPLIQQVSGGNSNPTAGARLHLPPQENHSSRQSRKSGHFSFSGTSMGF